MTFLPTNCITGPTVVILDLNNNDQWAYLKMFALATWGDDFDDWLREDHTRQFDEAQIRENKHASDHTYLDTNT